MRHPSRRRRTVGMTAFALAVTLGLAACSAPPAAQVDLPAQTDAKFPDETTAALQDAVTHAMAATGSTGAVVGVWAPWAGSWVTGLGTDQPAGAGSAVSVDATFRAAQITRAMTCDVLYSQVERGEVALDDPVTKWVSGVADLTDVTLGQLCDGTSGIGSYAGQLTPLWLSKPDRVWNPHELASYGLGLERSTPGAAYRDSDAGYVLLGLALEKATGQPASVLLKNYVFDRLDMTASRLPASAPRSGGVLPGYLSMPVPEGGVNCAAPTDMTTLSPTTGYTDSGVVTDIADLGRYAQALAAGALVPKGFDRLAHEVPAYDGAPSWLTAGGGVYHAGSLVGQYGSVPGYATAAFADPTTGLTVAVVLNNSAAGGAPAEWLAWELAALASKVPAAAGKSTPEAGLPWTAQQYHDAITGAAVCPLP